MFCSSCGSQVGDGSKFCASCGALTESPPTSSQVVRTPLQSAVGTGYSAPRATIPKFRATGWFLLAGAFAVVIAGFLPWAQLSVEGIDVQNASPRGGGPVVLIVLTAIAIAFGYPSVSIRSLAIWRRIGITAAAAVLTIFVITNWTDFNNLQTQYGGQTLADVNAGSGLYLYTAGIIVIWISAIRIWLARRDHSERSSSQAVFSSSPGTATPGGLPGQGQPSATVTEVSRLPRLPNLAGMQTHEVWRAFDTGTAVCGPNKRKHERTSKSKAISGILKSRWRQCCWRPPSSESLPDNLVVDAAQVPPLHEARTRHRWQACRGA